MTRRTWRDKIYIRAGALSRPSLFNFRTFLNHFTHVSLRLANGFIGRAEEGPPGGEIDKFRTLIPENVQHTGQHTGWQVHADNIAADIVFLEELPGIIEAQPGQDGASGTAQLDLCSIGLITRWAAINKQAVVFNRGHIKTPFQNRFNLQL